MKFFDKNRSSNPAVKAKNWYTDRYESVLVQRNILLIVTLFALVTTIFASLSIAWLMPQKSVEPFVIQIDERTGITQVVDPIKDAELSANEAVKRYFLYKYLMARESFLNDENKQLANYNTVRVMSENEDYGIYSAFRQSVREDNLDSPTNRYTGSILKIRVKSILFLNQNTAQIRFSGNEIKSGNYRVLRRTPYVAIVSFEFRDVALTAEERYINPLGFMVVGYDVNEEILN